MPSPVKLVGEGLVCPPYRKGGGGGSPQESWWGRVWCASLEGVPSPGELVGERLVCPPYRKGGGGESGVPPLEAWMGEH